MSSEVSKERLLEFFRGYKLDDRLNKLNYSVKIGLIKRSAGWSVSSAVPASLFGSGLESGFRVVVLV